MIETLHQFTAQLPPPLQWLGVLVLSMIPLVESHFAATLGVVAGLPLPLAVLLAAAGNLAVITLLVRGATGVRNRLTAGRDETPRQAKIRRALDRWGLIPVCLFGQMVVPNQIVAPTLVGLGARPERVVRWTAAGIALWALVFGGLAVAGVSFLV
ncbi:hypothetical protein GCM10027418_04220 [Mariniluteicoccus endophyticus]